MASASTEHCLEMAVFSGDFVGVVFLTVVLAAAGAVAVLAAAGAVVVLAAGLLAANAAVERKPAKTTEATNVTVFMEIPLI